MNITHLLALGFYGGQKNKIITDELLSADGPQLRGGASVKMQLIPAIRSAQNLGLKAAVLSLHKPIRADESFTQRK